VNHGIIIINHGQHVTNYSRQFLSTAWLCNHPVHTWAAIFLEHPANTSFMASIQGWTEALAALSREHSSCLSWPTWYRCLLKDSSFTLNPCLLAGQLNTNVQVNNMATPHHMYTNMHIYITLISLFILFFILLPFSWVGRLAQTLPVWHKYIYEGSLLSFFHAPHLS
jgi:hypothetical protein